MSSYQADISVPEHPQPNQMSQSIMMESGHIIQRVNVPGTDVQLVYKSSSASSAMSSLIIRLTPSRIPYSLYRIHIKIVVAGVVVRKLLEAEENLVYTHAWNKR